MLLVGIVFFNVDLLRMNREIAATAEKSSSLKRDNARLRQEAALLGSSERIQDAAGRLGLVLPAAGDVRYLKAHPGFDARKAARLIVAPTGEAPVPTATTIAPSPVTPVATTTPTTTPETPRRPPTHGHARHRGHGRHRHHRPCHHRHGAAPSAGHDHDHHGPPGLACGWSSAGSDCSSPSFWRCSASPPCGRSGSAR